MDVNLEVPNSIQVEGGSPLEGIVKIQGSKNAVLPLMVATLIMPGDFILRNCPNITDVLCMKKILESIGAKVNCKIGEIGIDISINTEKLHEYRMPEKYVKAMRSSVIIIGALLGRMGEVCIDYPGGCVIGERPIDIHLAGLKKMGAQIWIESNRIHAYADELKGAEVRLPFPSVGATQNLILAAVSAKGTTIIRNAAREPEVTQLCSFLNKMGACIKFSETFMTDGIIFIEGMDVCKLKSVEYEVVPDRIVAGTYMFATLAAGGDIQLERAPIEHLYSVVDIIKSMGGSIELNEKEQIIHLKVSDINKLVNIDKVKTNIYPAFPTDLQSMLMVSGCVAKGGLEIEESIFSQRFKIAQELERMGADIELKKGGIAIVRGGKKLTGRNVIAKELRGGAALVVAGLVADGITIVSDVKYIYRGYENILKDFTCLGAKIKAVQ